MTLAALRVHSRGTGWQVSTATNIIHIVTEQPAYLSAGQDPRDIKKAKLKRSRFRPGLSAVGINESFFHTPPPEKEAEARDVIKNTAEKAILQILGLKKLADMTAGTVDTISDDTARDQLTQVMTAFIDQMLEHVKMPKVTGHEN